MMSVKSLAIFAVLLMAPTFAAAQGLTPADSSEVNAPFRVDHRDVGGDVGRDVGPVLSSNDGWARTVVLAILLGLFVPAAIIGPWVRKRSAAELPELHVQEEQSALTASQHEPGHLR